MLFLVLPKTMATKVQTNVYSWIVPDKRQFVQIFSDEVATTVATDVRRQAAQDVIARLSAYSPHPHNRLIIDREAKCSIDDLMEWWDVHKFGDQDAKKLSQKAVLGAVKEHLEKAGWHWRVRAKNELDRFRGLPCKLDAWLQQFGELDCTSIGRKIAAKIRVVSTDELPGGAFAIRPSDLIGQRLAHCYVQDDDLGGSWIEMQAILTHTFPPHTVFPIRWEKEAESLLFPQVDVDEFVVYEDGLWSGIEAVRRLRALKKKLPSAPVTFRFAAVTDFGLMVIRQAIRSLDMVGRASIDASRSEFICFLKQNIPESFILGIGMESEDYSTGLHQHVEPFAFRLSEDWAVEEIGICKEIGAQLVRHWLSKDSTEPPLDEMVDRFALGGGRFASTVVFSRSVPKVCLPLLWLDGPIELQGKRLVWKPLFVDARRISDAGLLLSTAMPTPA